MTSDKTELRKAASLLARRRSPVPHSDRGASSGSVQIQHLTLELIDETERFRTRTKPYCGLQQLAASIKRLGQLNPLFVRKNGERYELIAGHRRLAVLKLLKVATAYCRVFSDLTDDDAYDLAISENASRLPLTEFERARARVRLTKMVGRR